MSEEKTDYITDAIEMMGAGYSQPAAVIDPPRMVRALRDNGLVNYSVWGWVKTSAKFRAHIKILRGAKHDIWHYLALGVDELGQCKETIKDICEGTGYSHTEVINSIKELSEMGYLSIYKDSKGNTYTPEFVARGENKPTESVVKKVESTPVYQVESTPPLEKSPSSIKRVKRVNAKAKNNIPYEVKIFREVTNRYPNKVNYGDVSNILKSVSARLGRDVTADDLMPFFSAWTARGFNPANINWTSWAVTGIIPQQGGQQRIENRPELSTL